MHLFSKLKHIPHIASYVSMCTELCLSCPMAKMTKQPFQHSVSKSQHPFDLVRIDIWALQSANS